MHEMRNERPFQQSFTEVIQEVLIFQGLPCFTQGRVFTGPILFTTFSENWSQF